MEKDKLLHYVAPCSLLCYTCLALKDGAFSECAPRLNIYSEGVCEFLTANSSEEEREELHSFFNRLHDALCRLSGGLCHGCRNDLSLQSGCIEGCIIPVCVKGHGVDFCAECSEFPCKKAKEFFDTHDDKLSQVWENGSCRMKEIGIDAYFEEKKNVSHYTHYIEKTE